VTKLKWCTMRVSLGRYIVGVAAATSLLTLSPIARAQEGDSEVDELRKQVRQLEAQVQALRAAINDSIDVNRQQIASLNRALKGQGPAPSESAPPPRAESASDNVRPPPSLPKLAPGKGGAVATRGSGRRRAANDEAPTGVIRGRVEVPSGEPVAYVYVENVFEPAVHHKEVIQQKQKQFVPRWAVVQRGTTIEFPNNDNIYHNVFSLSSGNSFDLGLYNSASEAKSQTFNEPGAVDIYCNIHPQMVASTLVVPNRYFAKVKSDGTYELAGVPSGKRKIVAWAPGSHLTSQWVQVDSGASAELNLKLESKAAGHKNKNGRAYGSYE
jgi:plastocyanin